MAIDQPIPPEQATVTLPPPAVAPTTLDLPPWLMQAVLSHLTPLAQQAAQAAATDAVAGVTTLAGTLQDKVTSLDALVKAFPIATPEDVRRIATEAGQEAATAQKAVVAGVQEDLTQLQADFTAHRAQVEQALAGDAQTAITRLISDKRFFWVEVGTLVVLAALTISLLFLWVATGNARAEEVMKWVGIATLVKIPSGAAAVAARSVQAK